MRTLAIETATEALSIALFDDNEVIAARHDLIGRGHAERLIPLIAELPRKGEADRILVSLGPGSFTGTRIGIAAARALGLAWNAQVLGYPTLALVAAGFRAEHGAAPSLAVMTGGHGEWFVQSFAADGQPLDELRSMSPDAAATDSTCEAVIGSQAEALVGMRSFGQAYKLLPNARWTMRLPPAYLRASIAPIYGRAPDARPTATSSA